MNYEEYGRVVATALLKDNTIYYSYKGHYDIFTMEPIGVLRKATQGFITENGFFVDRTLGLKIAEYYDQIENKYPPLYGLNSEDLKKENIKVLKHINNMNYRKKDTSII